MTEQAIQHLRNLQPQRFCLTTKELCETWHYSEQTLRRLRANQVFKPGIHFVIKGYGSVRPRLLWDPIAVQTTRERRKPNKAAANSAKN